MRKLTHFDGLRGLAAFVAFLAHFRPTFCLNIDKQVLDATGITGENTRAVALNFMTLLYEGALPVFIFWLLSAYVISIKLFQPDKIKSEKYLVEASTKRYFRLAIPVFVSSFICFLLMKANFMYNIELAQQLGSGYADGWLNQQYHFVPGFFHFIRTSFIEVFLNGNCNYNFALWTMAPELLGSLMCFALFALIGKNSERYIVYLTAIVLLTFGGLRDVTYFFYLTFIIGIMWCDVMNSKDEVTFKPQFKRIFNSKPMTIGLLIISFAVPIFSEVVHPLPYNLYYLFAFPLKAVAITLTVHQFGFIKKMFSTKPFRFMGKISFSLYLLHIPLMFSVGAYMYLNAGIPVAYKLPLTFAVVLTSLILVSYMFERFIDRPSIKFANNVGKYFSASKGISPADVRTIQTAE